jgi:uncharacterized protein YfbU (UPF0304 family)
MKLDEKDRLILINQYRILTLLDPEHTDEYEERLEILRSGYEVFYDSLDESLCKNMPKNEGQFVLDLLSLYRIVEKHKNDNPDDIDVTNHRMATFNGFDGNYETEYMGFVRFLINNLGRFEEQKEI